LHIGIDAWNLRDDRRGIGRYVREIVRCWQLSYDGRNTLSLIVPERFPWFVAPLYVRALSGRRIAVRSREIARAKPFDVLWYPWNGISWNAPGCKVATLHDASLFALPPADPEVARREQLPFRAAAKDAARIITDSAFSKVELEKHLDIDGSRIDVVYLGVSERFFAPSASRSTDPDLPPRYALFVGEAEPRKGLDVLLAAAAALPETIRSGLAVVVAGRVDRAAVSVPSGIDVRFAGHVDDDRLRMLYAGAAAFVYPSRYEGFGLPVLEAMASGAPVIASRAGGIPEAGGDAAYYVEPGDPGALASALCAVLSDPATAQTMRDAGRRHAATMTWEAAASKTLAVFARAAACVAAGG
jgi:glycosyltransferase involved in cell wall biosynthesis